MNSLHDLHQQASTLPNSPLMPVLFIGHGSPMNAIEDNEFARKWLEIGSNLPQPNAIVCISAHWETKGTFVTAMQQPKTIHDFYGFPPELYAQQYPAAGLPSLANEIKQHVTKYIIEEDHKWGFDHGTWSILKYLYPKANIPVLQISIDYTQPMQHHYDLAKELMFLRKKGVLIIGSGNMIHNLRMLQVKGEDFNSPFGFDWAIELNELFKNKIGNSDHKSLIEYNSLSKWTQLAIPSTDHYIPMLYALALQTEKEEAHFFNDSLIAGSLSMTSFIIN